MTGLRQINDCSNVIIKLINYNFLSIIKFEAKKQKKNAVVKKKMINAKEILAKKAKKVTMEIKVIKVNVVLRVNVVQKVKKENTVQKAKKVILVKKAKKESEEFPEQPLLKAICPRRLL